MSRGLVLLTGGSGFVGFSTLVIALEAGYSVRAAVRSQKKADDILATPSVKRLATFTNLSFIIVPDITDDAAFDKAVQGVDYILHIAAPIPNKTEDITTDEQFKKTFFEPSLKGTLEILHSAARTKGIKRVVVTSSGGAIIPFDVLSNGDATTVYTANSRQPVDEGPYTAGQMQAYTASKTLSLKAVEDYFRNNKPEFDHVIILPCFVLGRSELHTTSTAMIRGSNHNLLDLVLGKDNPITINVPVSLSDTAELHVLALDKDRVKSGESLLATTTVSDWNIYKDVLRAKFPEAVKKGWIKFGSNTTGKVLVDNKRAEEVLGRPFKTYEAMVEETVGQYVELLEKENA